MNLLIKPEKLLIKITQEELEITTVDIKTLSVWDAAKVFKSLVDAHRTDENITINLEGDKMFIHYVEKAALQLGV